MCSSDLEVHVVLAECHERDHHALKHQFSAEEHDDQVPASQKTDQAQHEQQGAGQQEMIECQCGHGNFEVQGSRLHRLAVGVSPRVEFRQHAFAADHDRTDHRQQQNHARQFNAQRMTFKQRQPDTVDIGDLALQFRTQGIGQYNGFGFALIRSEERRVGKECRSRWSPYQ